MVKKYGQYLWIVLLAMACALNYKVFVFPNAFAPAGLDGICTMVQDVLEFNMGYLALAVNLPLVVAAFLVLNREFAVKSTLFVIVMYLAVIWLDDPRLAWLCFYTENGTSTVLAPVAAGAVRGLLYAATLGCNGSGGGIDIVSALIKHKRPHLELMNIIFAMNAVIAAASYFVYGRSLEPVICSLVYAFMTTVVCNALRGISHKAVKYEIFTRDASALVEQLSQLGLEAVALESKEQLQMVVCYVKKSRCPAVETVLLGSSCKVYKTPVREGVTGITYK